MDNKDADNFRSLVEGTISMSKGGQLVRLPDIMLRQWWLALSPYPIDAIEKAFSVFLRQYSRSPFPADIIKILTPEDDRPMPEEAWAIGVQSFDQRNTIRWTTEIEESINLVRELYMSGDKVGARMAFKEHYARLTERAKKSGVPVKWNISVGHDPEQRDLVVREAVDSGVMKIEQATHYLLPQETEEGKEARLLLTDQSQQTKTDFGKRMRRAWEEAQSYVEKQKAKRKAEHDAYKAREEERRKLLLKQQEELLLKARENYREINKAG